MKRRKDIVRIVAIIWIAALFLNTLFGTALLTSLFTDAQMVMKFALIGFVFAAILSVPLVLVLFVCLRLFLRMEIFGRKLFLLFFLVGNILTAATFVFFSFTDIAAELPLKPLFLVVTTSASLAMLLEYRSIIHLTKPADDPTFKTFLKD